MATPLESTKGLDVSTLGGLLRLGVEWENSAGILPEAPHETDYSNTTSGGKRHFQL